MGLIDSNAMPQKVAEALDSAKLDRNDAIHQDSIPDLDNKVKQALSDLEVAKSLKAIINAKEPMILKVLKAYNALKLAFGLELHSCPGQETLWLLRLWWSKNNMSCNA